jgi:hypothetical protein
MKCEWCGRTNKAERETCGGCGATAERPPSWFESKLVAYGDATTADYSRVYSGRDVRLP